MSSVSQTQNWVDFPELYFGFSCLNSNLSSSFVGTQIGLQFSALEKEFNFPSSSLDSVEWTQTWLQFAELKFDIRILISTLGSTQILVQFFELKCDCSFLNLKLSSVFWNQNWFIFFELVLTSVFWTQVWVELNFEFLFLNSSLTSVFWAQNCV